MIFEPYARIQDVAQKVNVLHTGQALEAAGAIGQQQLKISRISFLIPGLSAQGAQGIVCAFAVPGQVVVGIQQVDNTCPDGSRCCAAPATSGPAGNRTARPSVPQSSRKRHPGLAALGLVPGQPIQTGADGAALAGPAGGGLLRGGASIFSKPRPSRLWSSFHLSCGVVVVQSHAQVRAVIGGAAGTPVHLPDGVDGAVVTACRTGALALIQAGQQQIQKGQVIAQGQPPPEPWSAPMRRQSPQ